MDTLEFSQRLIRVLDDNVLQEILKKAATQGFSVQGFKNPWRAPKPAIIKDMKRKKRGGEYYYIIILETIAKLDSLNEVATMAKQWLQNDNGDILYKKIEDELKRIEEKKNNVFIEEKKPSSLEPMIVEDNLLNENKEMQKKNGELKEKNKKLQLIIQGNKIEISNLKKDVTQLKKINEKLEKDFEKKQSECEQYQSDSINYNKQIKEKDEQIELLLKKIDELKRYKECAPKILCFIKTNTDEMDLGVYDITYAKEWNDVQRASIVSQVYDEIWIVHKGFSFNDITEIKANVSCTVKEFLSLARLKNKIGGRK